jgi:hypothetical protein
MHTEKMTVFFKKMTAFKKNAVAFESQLTLAA